MRHHLVESQPYTTGNIAECVYFETWHQQVTSTMLYSPCVPFHQADLGVHQSHGHPVWKDQLIMGMFRKAIAKGNTFTISTLQFNHLTEKDSVTACGTLPPGSPGIPRAPSAPARPWETTEDILIHNSILNYWFACAWFMFISIEQGQDVWPCRVIACYTNCPTSKARFPILSFSNRLTTLPLIRGLEAF